MTPLVLADWQLERARSLKPGERMQVWVPVESQPEPHDTLPDHWIMHSKLTVNTNALLAECPYGQPGDLVRMPFCETCEDSGCPFPEDRPNCVVHHCPDCLSRQLRLTDVRVAKLGEMTEQDARECGVPESSMWAHRTYLAVRWNAQHPEHPWSEGVVCWALHLEATT